MPRGMHEQNVRRQLAGGLYGTGSCAVLWGIAGLFGLIPAWLSASTYWAIGGGTLLWVLGLVVEKSPAERTPKQPPSLALQDFSPPMLESLQFRERAQAELDTEADDFPVLMPREGLFSSNQPIEFTFDDLARLPSLVQQAIEDRLDEAVVPPLDKETAPTQGGDRYRLKLDGPRFDVRTLRSLD